ncbi:hypothetical protein V6N12_039228 [Hibiscus sabdariffa]|uniref:Protein kinase domain-containing protein n=1 Tax=Hibiscus sabdariffa TaxID=183260 RepID=A0ABR2E0E5_9ROSI
MKTVATGVIHWDIKPNNVMIGEEFNAQLGDFGLARLLQGYMAMTTMLSGKSAPESDVCHGIPSSGSTIDIVAFTRLMRWLFFFLATDIMNQSNSEKDNNINGVALFVGPEDLVPLNLTIPITSTQISMNFNRNALVMLWATFSP